MVTDGVTFDKRGWQLSTAWNFVNSSIGPAIQSNRATVGIIRTSSLRKIQYNDKKIYLQQVT